MILSDVVIPQKVNGMAGSNVKGILRKILMLTLRNVYVVRVRNNVKHLSVPLTSYSYFTMISKRTLMLAFAAFE